MATDLETVPPPARSATGRAGRDLRAAIGVGAALGALVIGTLVAAPDVFLGVVLAAVLLGLWELVQALRAGGHGAAFVPLALGTAATVVLGYVYDIDRMVVAALLAAVAVVVWRIPEGPARLLPDVAAGVFALLYVGFMAGFAGLMLAASHGPARMGIFVGTVVASDVGGYTAGVLGGRHPMSPAVSPKKTWEGLAGSVVLCAVVAAILFTTLLSAPAWQGALFGVTIAASATLGDLGESMVKRDLGIKDMGRLLPGHGGLMDRLDSLLPSAPVAWGLFGVFVGVH
jgi:phosphatidate cytidylyltransferase